MMKLNLMKQFFDSVDKQWRSSIADEITRKWFSENFHTYCIRASANFAFLVKVGEQKYLLRFNHASERQVGYIAAELMLIEHLAASGMRVNKPQFSLAGNLIESVNTAMGLFHCVLFDFMPGEHLELEALDFARIKNWGRALGQMHQASAGLKIEGRPDWQEQIALIRSLVPANETLVWQETAAVEASLRALPIHAANYGLIHFDFEPDNLVWPDDEPGIYDLDDCAYDWFAMDIANALASELFDDRLEHFDVTDPRLQAFLEGYRSVRPLDEQEVQWMPLFLRLDNLLAFARVYRSILEAPLDDEPQWTKDLRQKLGRELAQYRESFRNHPIRDFLPRG